jgi:hypothetical protein
VQGSGIAAQIDVGKAEMARNLADSLPNFPASREFEDEGLSLRGSLAALLMTPASKQRLTSPGGFHDKLR